ncbi:MAG: cyclodeaminase/cyclohydrolase family protein [Calothrix sp. CSU_2_0]|nr:cyclodeaminase/cyclohydrolase family protein [Calothrix sp. CSU_2_0]
MVANLTIGKKKYADVQGEAEAVLREAAAVRAELVASYQDDIAAFDQAQRLRQRQKVGGEKRRQERVRVPRQQITIGGEEHRHRDQAAEKTLQQPFHVERTADEEFRRSHLAHDRDLVIVEVGGQADDARDRDHRCRDQERAEQEPSPRKSRITVWTCSSQSRSSSTVAMAGSLASSSAQAARASLSMR